MDSRLSTMFSVVVKPGMRLNSWWTMPMPASRASKGLEKLTSSPSMQTLPL